MQIDRCRIMDNRQIAKDIWRMTFSSFKIAVEYNGPGQFVSILADHNWQHALRRPMSITNVKDDSISIIYKIVGNVTNKFSTLKYDNYINVFGPTGNTFSRFNDGCKPVLIGGGVGLAPILNLFEKCNKQNISTYTILGAKTAAEHFLKHDPENQFYLTTDDGTLGVIGTVLDTLKMVLPKIDNPKIFACGPEPMLKSIQSFIKDLDIPTQFSVESYMACGIGICQGCAITKNTEELNYSLVCKDGPVYDAQEVIFG